MRDNLADKLIDALSRSDPGALIEEREKGWYTIDGRFELAAVVDAMFNDRPA